MLASVLEPIINWVIQFVSDLGFAGVFLGMAIEAASIPLPSEIIMGIAGFLVYDGRLNVGGNPVLTIIVVGLIGALGNALGSTSMYVLGSRGGRPVLNKYGKYVHVTEEKFERVEGWLKKYGDKIIFIGQLLPVIRTFISLPLGILKVNFVKFRIYTFVGAFIWCTLLATVSYFLGEEWKRLTEYIHQFEIVIAFALAAAIAYFIIKKVYKRRKDKIEANIKTEE